MNLSKISDSEILVRMEKLACSERKMTHVILCHINEVHSRKLFAQLGYSSLHKYLVEHLGYADDAAYRREQAARVLKQVPAIAEKIEDGSLNLSQLTRVQKCLRQERKVGNQVMPSQAAEVLEQLANKNNYETQKILAVEFNQPAVMHEIVRPQSNDSVRLEMSLTEEQMATIKKAKDLLSHVLPEADFADLFFYLAEEKVKKILGKNAPCGKNPASTPEVRFDNHKNTIEMPRRLSAARKYISVKVKRQLLRDAHHVCEFIDSHSGNKCTSSYQLQIDHRVPLACGGLDIPENYRVLCRTHNLLEARRWGIGTA